MRLVSIGTLSLLQVVEVRAIVAFEPDNFRVAFKRKNVCGHAIEKPPVV